MLRLSQAVRVAMLGGALLLPVLAQTADRGVTTTDTSQDRDRGFNYGWLGLLGLAGLIPRRQRTHDVADARTTR